MKNLITIILILFALTATAQDYTLMHINAKWKENNNFDLRGIKGAKVQMAYLEDQKASLRDQLKAVPLIILLDKDGKPRGPWKAGFSFKITSSKEEKTNRKYNLMSQE